MGSRAYCWISSTFSGVMSISLASSSGVGSRPRSWSSSRWMRPSLLITSTMCTGMRMVRAWSAMARVIACRLHQGLQVLHVRHLVDPAGDHPRHGRPGGVRGELVALGVVELLDRTDQAEVALLDQVQERHAAAGVALGEGDHEPEIGLEQVVLGAFAVADDPVEVAPHLRRDLDALVLDLAHPLGR